jgi:4-hydroxythreonine-4-phosphate dehydrogenase
MNTFVFTCGDINGIGPEIVIKSLNRMAVKPKQKFIYVCPRNVFLNQIKITEPKFDFEICSSNYYLNYHTVSVINSGDAKQNFRKPTVHSGKAAFQALEIAFSLTRNLKRCALVTAPISKTALSLAGIKYPGHTEMLADWCKVKNFAMMFLAKQIKAALMTIHVPVKEISKKISKKSLEAKIHILLQTLKKDFGISSPRIALLGLNPHAGENGLIGDEENKVIIPVMKNHAYKKHLYGPFPSDGFFGKKMYLNYDLVLGMYHDQILNPFKLLNFNNGVNYTAGLPIIRTSPDHGTAFEIAGKNIADESSIYEAFRLAKQILNNRKSSE